MQAPLSLFPVNPAIEKAKRSYRNAVSGRRREMWIKLRDTVKAELQKEMGLRRKRGKVMKVADRGGSR